jgi:hypothetical protein
MGVGAAVVRADRLALASMWVVPIYSSNFNHMYQMCFDESVGFLSI